MSKEKPFRLAIIGRPNVGKSTLFNRLLGRKRALVHDLPGVTRDRLEEPFEWIFGKDTFSGSLVDTGGVGEGRFKNEILDQVDQALKDATLAIWVIDSRSGLTAEDRELAKIIRSQWSKQCPIWLAVNKVDTAHLEGQSSEHFELGIDPVFEISAEHNRGVETLKDKIFDEFGVETFETDEEEAQDAPEDSDDRLDSLDSDDDRAAQDRVLKIAIVGRPNVGKSTLTNTLLGQSRMIVSPIAGTTIDSIDSFLELDGKTYCLIDTAGVRRKDRTEQGVEVLSVVQTKKAIERADVVCLVLDGETGVTDQDEKIGGMIDELGKPLILIVNKWDTQKGKKGFDEEVASEWIRDKVAFLRYAPLLFVSALRKTGLEELPTLIEEVIAARDLKLTTREFSDFVRTISQNNNPRNARFFLCHQSGRHPPTFVCHVNDPEKVHFSLKRHLINSMRLKWGFMGNPIKLLFIEGKNRRSLPKAKKGPARTRPKAATKSG